jgi:hypothetical protein
MVILMIAVSLLDDRGGRPRRAVTHPLLFDPVIKQGACHLQKRLHDQLVGEGVSQLAGAGHMREGDNRRHEETVSGEVKASL